MVNSTCGRPSTWPPHLHPSHVRCLLLPAYTIRTLRRRRLLFIFFTPIFIFLGKMADATRTTTTTTTTVLI
jgi:hypothetical protein